MRRALVRSLWATGAVAGVVAMWTWTALPPARGGTTGTPIAGDVRVAYHVHSQRSDGTGTIEQIAAAAVQAGVAAVVLTDHGDGTRVVDAPRYLAGVLIMDAVEVSTWAGHYVVLGAAPSPYPLGGEPDAVVEDVRRLGGVGIAAHPGSPKEGLKWRDWDAPIDGLEWLNADSEWRDRPRDLGRAVATYSWRATETISALLNRPSFELAQWDRLAARRQVVGLAAHDAHARLGLRGVGEPYDGVVALKVPAYAPMFAAFSNVVRLAQPLSGEAATDSLAVSRAIAAGHVYAVVTGVAPSGRVRFTAESGGQSAGMGDHLVPVGPVALVFDADVPADARTTLVCEGRPVAGSAGGRVSWTAMGHAGACRAEVMVGSDAARVPWLVTNPIYVRPLLSEASPRALAAPQVVLPLAGSGEVAQWSAELAPGARGQAAPVDGHPRRVAFSWQLGDAAGQYAALRIDPAAVLAGFDRIILRAAADRPMRIWLQLRAPQGGGRRWGRSVYLDQTSREIVVPFSALLPLDGEGARAVPLGDVTALLIVVDTVHGRPGSAGTISFDELWLAR